MTAASSDGWDLVAAAQQGDREAFGRLYSRYAPGVSRFVGSRLRDRDLAQDLTSETFARALRRIDSVSYQGRDAGAWFTTIARNLITDHVKSSRVQRETVTAEFDDAGTDHESPEQAAIRTETAADVRRRVSQLPTDQQECIRLRFFNELSVAETAAVMAATRARSKPSSTAAWSGSAPPSPRTPGRRHRRGRQCPIRWTGRGTRWPRHGTTWLSRLSRTAGRSSCPGGTPTTRPPRTSPTGGI
jgi:RNA polymerase sigma-70 factor (ECF subfamily)